MTNFEVTFFDGVNSNTLHIVCNDNEIKTYMHSILQGVNINNELIRPCKYLNKTGFYFYSKKEKKGARIVAEV